MLAAVPEVGQEKVSVCIPPCNPTNPEAGQKTFSWGVLGTGKWRWGAMRFNRSDIMKKRISKSLMKTAITKKKKGPSEAIRKQRKAKVV